ncbi:MAG: cytochrome P450 [Solirubrobacteraceae bacterium]
MASPDRYPVGAGVTVEQLDADPHPVLARLREREPVSWIPVLDGWLVTRHDLALTAMRDASTFTVDDPRFSTARVIGPSMLSLDGDEHARHRTPFVAPFRSVAVRERFAQAAAQEAWRLIDGLRRGGTEAELRRAFAGPLAAAIVTRALGLEAGEVPAVLRWYEAIVSTVTKITAGAEVDAEGRLAFSALSERLSAVIEEPGSDSLLAAAAQSTELSREQIVSNAAVLLFGGIETTEGMIAGALLHLLQRTDRLKLIRSQPDLLDAAIEESLRLEPAAAVIDRYATRETTLGNAQIARGELVRLSIAAANRDPAVFGDPDQFDLQRPNTRRHLAFAQGPHVCVGVHLARLETRTGLAVLIEALPGLRLDPERLSEFRGLVFRKPAALHVNWE